MTPVSEACRSSWIVGIAGTIADVITAYARPATETTTSVTRGLDRFSPTSGFCRQRSV